MQRLTAGLRDAGVPLLAGSDPFAPCVIPGFSLKVFQQEGVMLRGRWFSKDELQGDLVLAVKASSVASRNN